MTFQTCNSKKGIGTVVASFHRPPKKSRHKQKRCLHLKTLLQLRDFLINMAPTTRENATNIEEGIPATSNAETKGASTVVKHQLSSRLSFVSKKYDVEHGDGKLDAAARAMRDMD
jgi:hypothetical protein